MVKLKIKNFGPIVDGFTENDGFMNISQVILICGNQATGKSTIAKIFSTLSWLEKAMFRGDYDTVSISNRDFFVDLLKNQRIHEYLTEKSEIIYIGNLCNFSFSDNDFIAEIKDESIKDYVRPKIMYVPSERNLLTILEDVEEMHDLPIMLSILLKRYRVARKKLASDSYGLPVSNIKIKYDSGKNITKVISLNNQEVEISNSSSGIQSVTPLSLVSDYLSQSVSQDVFENIQKLSESERNKIERDIIKQFDNKDLADEVLKELNIYFITGTKQGIKATKTHYIKGVLQYYFNQCFINIIEEPEQNLYPQSQSKVLYKLLEYMNRNSGNQLLITTHSPYIIAYLTLCAKAYELKEKGVDLNKLNEIVPLDSIVSGENISIYETTEDGKIELLEPYNNLPSDDNLLNKLMEEQNESFVRLLELEAEK